jgi:hypothetical protein
VDFMVRPVASGGDGGGGGSGDRSKTTAHPSELGQCV